MSKKMPKKKSSFLWQYFHPSSSNKACCNLCKHNLSYKTTTTNLKKHIERRHPNLLKIGRDGSVNNNDTDMLKLDHPNIEVEECSEEESMFIEYCDDSNMEQEKLVLEKSGLNRKDLFPKIFRIPMSKKPANVEKSQADKLRKHESESKFSHLGNPQNELIKIEIEVAKKNLELKEKQLLYAKREDERRQKEHEVILKIKEAQLQAVINRK